VIDEPLQFLVVLMVGSASQLVDGTRGMGFGVSSAALLLTAGFPPAISVATVNVAKIVTGLFSGLSHWRVGNVRKEWLAPLVLPGIIGGSAGTYFMLSLPPGYVRFWMSVVLVGMGLMILWRSLLPPTGNPGPSLLGSASSSERLRRLGLGALGLIAGFLNALSGAYGPFATSAVILTARSRPYLAVGTVSLAEFFVACAVVITFLSAGGVEGFSWDLALALTIGGAITAPLAASICRRLPPRMLVVGVSLTLICLSLGVVLSGLR